ncbi:unnamed protein product, partial [Adineta ricciae]
MSITFFSLCAILCISAISAGIPPMVIYSAVIENQQDHPVQCSITWSKYPGDRLERTLFTVERQQEYFANEQRAKVDTMVVRATIEEIRCGDLVLKAPLGVTKPFVTWRFAIRQNAIVP